MHFNPPAFQQRRDPFSGPVFLHPQFGMGVEVPADLGQRGVLGADGVKGGHAANSGEIGRCSMPKLAGRRQPCRRPAVGLAADKAWAL